jgi:hypothetical protein
MKMVQESATELVYRQGMNVLLLIWSLGFAGIPLVMLIGLFSDSGITRIDCVRPPQQTSIHSPNSFVNCRAQRLTFWGLAPQKAQSIPRVLRAHQVSEITPSKSDCSSMQDLHKSGDDDCCYQLFIKPKVGQPIELSSSADQDSLKEMADKILEALTMPGETEQQTSPDSLIP